jgi:hypothetical protein
LQQRVCSILSWSPQTHFRARTDRSDDEGGGADEGSDDDVAAAGDDDDDNEGDFLLHVASCARNHPSVLYSLSQVAQRCPGVGLGGGDEDGGGGCCMGLLPKHGGSFTMTYIRRGETHTRHTHTHTHPRTRTRVRTCTRVHTHTRTSTRSVSQRLAVIAAGNREYDSEQPEYASVLGSA